MGEEWPGPPTPPTPASSHAPAGPQPTYTYSYPTYPYPAPPGYATPPGHPYPDKKGNKGLWIALSIMGVLLLGLIVTTAILFARSGSGWFSLPPDGENCAMQRTEIGDTGLAFDPPEDWACSYYEPDAWYERSSPDGVDWIDVYVEPGDPGDVPPDGNWEELKAYYDEDEDGAKYEVEKSEEIEHPEGPALWLEYRVRDMGMRDLCEVHVLAPDPETLIKVEQCSKSDRDDETGREVFRSIG